MRDVELLRAVFREPCAWPFYLACWLNEHELERRRCAIETIIRSERSNLPTAFPVHLRPYRWDRAGLAYSPDWDRFHQDAVNVDHPTLHRDLRVDAALDH